MLGLLRAWNQGESLVERLGACRWGVLGLGGCHWDGFLPDALGVVPRD